MSERVRRWGRYISEELDEVEWMVIRRLNIFVSTECLSLGLKSYKLYVGQLLTP